MTLSFEENVAQRNDFATATFFQTLPNFSVMLCNVDTGSIATPPGELVSLK
jgi:hypothetical protein